MGKRVRRDLVGRVFGRWTVLKFSHEDRHLHEAGVRRRMRLRGETIDQAISNLRCDYLAEVHQKATRLA
jgi:ribosomal protein S6E (S10)